MLLNALVNPRAFNKTKQRKQNKTNNNNNKKTIWQMFSILLVCSEVREIFKNCESLSFVVCFPHNCTTTTI
jgi:hypothetical protein